MGSYRNIALSACICWFGVLSLLLKSTLADTCTTANRRQQLDSFDCPRRGDDWDEHYCCGPPNKQKCCDYEDYLEENPNMSGGLVAVIVILSMLFFACTVLVFCCCCSCCYLAQRRQRRGLVLASGSPPTTVITTTTTANQQPSTAVYPRQTYYQPVAQTYPPSQLNTAQPTFANTGNYQYQNHPESNVYPPARPLEYEKPPPYYES